MDFFTELLQYIINVLPSNTAGDVVAVVTFIVTLCTLVIRFWKEPDPKADCTGCGLSFIFWPLSGCQTGRLEKMERTGMAPMENRRHQNTVTIALASGGARYCWS